MTLPEQQTEIVVARHPVGLPEPADFAERVLPVPMPADGELLLRVHWLSIDPWLRPLLGGRHLVPPPPVGTRVPGQVVGEVLVSRDAHHGVGDWVVADCGWCEYATVAADAVRRVDPAIAPPSAWLGVLGIPGLTAWAGLGTIARPRPGDTVLVSTAAGALGSVVCQLARAAGADVVGIAGSADKCAIAVADYGCRTCIDHHAADFPSALAAACPDGIDVYFDNVGGRVLEAAIGRLRRNARVVLCGMIDQYNRDVRPAGPNLGPVIAARASLTGLVVHDHIDRHAEMVAELAPLIAQGRLRWREDVSIGIGMAPDAFCGLMRGQNVGKALVQVAADGWRC